MTKKKRGKRAGLRARSKNARKGKPPQRVRFTKPKYTGVRTPLEEFHNVDDIVRIRELEGKLARCRTVMEANDPGNALDIFGPPLAAKAEGETAKQEPPNAQG